MLGNPVVFSFETSPVNFVLPLNARDDLKNSSLFGIFRKTLVIFLLLKSCPDNREINSTADTVNTHTHTRAFFESREHIALFTKEALISKQRKLRTRARAKVTLILSKSALTRMASGALRQWARYPTPHPPTASFCDSQLTYRHSNK